MMACSIDVKIVVLKNHYLSKNWIRGEAFVGWMEFKMLGVCVPNRRPERVRGICGGRRAQCWLVLDRRGMPSIIR